MLHRATLQRAIHGSVGGEDEEFLADYFSIASGSNSQECKLLQVMRCAPRWSGGHVGPWPVL